MGDGSATSGESVAFVKFEVVHDKVAIRKAPSTNASMVGATRRGQVVRGKPLQIEGIPWLQLDDASQRELFLKTGSAWMLVDGCSVGLGQLLKRLDSSDTSEFYGKLSRSQRISLQEGCIAKYVDEGFQQKLHETWFRLEGDVRKQIEARAALCSNGHSRVLKVLLKKPCSSTSLLLNIFQAHACFTEQDLPSSAEAELSSWLIWLLNPCAQKSHPRGLPPEISSSTARTLTEISGIIAGSNPPRPRVLARARLAATSCSSSSLEVTLSVHVCSALSGELLCKLSAQSFETIGDLKRKVSALTGIGAVEQKIIHGPHILKDWETLQSIRSLKSSGAGKNSDSKVNLSLMRLAPERADCLSRLESGNLNLWDLELPNAEDPECALASIRGNGLGLKFVPEALHSHFDFIIEAVRLQGDALKYASKELRATPEIVLTAVKQDGLALRHAAYPIRNDRAIVLEAVEKNGLALSYASEELRANLEVALAAVEQSGLALQYAHPDVANLRDVAIVALQQDKEAHEFIGHALRQDLSFLKALDDLGLLEDMVLQPLLWIDVKHASGLLQRGVTLFLDARSSPDFRVSHVRGALSLPYVAGQDNVSKSPVHHMILENPSLIVIVYSDTGEQNSPCAHIARRLRNQQEIRNHRVLRLNGGLNAWKDKGFDVEGDTRMMVDGFAVDSFGNYIQESAAANILKSLIMSAKS